MLLAFYGALSAAHLAVSVLFLRLWFRNGARLLSWFAAAFALLAIAYGLQCCFQAGLTPRAPAFLVRLAAFILIIFGIVSANRRDRAGS